MHNFIDKLGDYNPQLFREIKGRLKPRNILLAVTISVVSQFLLLMSFFAHLPSPPEPGSKFFDTYNQYCTGKGEYGNPKCLLDDLGNVVINWHSWYLDLFIWLSTICVFTLLVMGTYLLINDLSTEERRDTLNFLRLTPQEPQTILLGKMMGVPILLYLAIALTIPLNLWTGLSANVTLAQILSFYGVVFAACICYYSAGLLFGLVGSWLGGFQSWLGSGSVLGFLLLSIGIASEPYNLNSWIFLRFINPFFLIPQVEKSSIINHWEPWENVRWFLFNLGNHYTAIVAFTIINFAILTYFFWQGLQRCFRDANGTMLSKYHSYLFMLYFATITVGIGFSSEYKIADNIFSLLFLNFWAFLYLIAAITPHRQSLIDWARFRHLDLPKYPSGSSFFTKDLLSNDKSPAILALITNAIIAIACISSVIVVANQDYNNKVNAVTALGLAFSLATLYVVIFQICLFMKTRHRVVASIFIVGAVMILPLIVVAVLFHNPNKFPFLWLFSLFAPAFALYPSSSNWEIVGEGFVAIILQLAIAGFLILKFASSLQKAGESQTKAIT